MATRKKTVKKKPPIASPLIPAPYKGYTEAYARTELHFKLMRVRERLPMVMGTNKHTDKSQGETFTFTSYTEVMSAVLPILTDERLTFIPYASPTHQTVVQNVGTMFFVTTHCAITDVDTGYQEIVPACGLGKNKWWAIDSAMTLAVKHALLQSCMINWECPVPTEEQWADMLSPTDYSKIVTEGIRSGFKTLRDEFMNSEVWNKPSSRKGK